jgi:hypothetical protein
MGVGETVGVDVGEAVGEGVPVALGTGVFVGGAGVTVAVAGQVNSSPGTAMFRASVNSLAFQSRSSLIP